MAGYLQERWKREIFTFYLNFKIANHIKAKVPITKYWKYKKSSTNTCNNIVFFDFKY